MSFTLQRIQAFCLTAIDLEALTRFYVQALGFTASAPEPIPADEMALLGIEGGGQRVSLQLHQAQIRLDRFDASGRGFPRDTCAADPLFQHFALVTCDAMAAWRRVCDHGAIAISDGAPVTLPASAGAVTAVKFRDPEGHPLELLQFAATPPNWSGVGVLGVDHSALSVPDLDAAQSFFLAHGLRRTAHTLNSGPEQSRLDGLDPVAVDVVSLQTPLAEPHIELLGYRTPRPRAALTMNANDCAATRTVWQSDIDALVRDPSGHLHLLRRKPH